MAMAQEDERQLLTVDDGLPMAQILRKADDLGSPSRSRKVVTRSLLVISLGLMIAGVTVTLHKRWNAVPLSPQESVDNAAQLYDPWVQKCADPRDSRGQCQCNCEWAHRDGLTSSSGCSVRNDGSCCHACCCGSQEYRQVHSFTARRYNCLADYNDWRRAWSPAKRDFCCNAHGRGCTSGEMNLMQSPYQDHYHDTSYRHHDDQRGVIRYDDHANYDCEAGYSNWRRGWSYKKKEFCCSNYHVGCQFSYMRMIIGCCVVAIVAIALAVWCVNNNQKK